MTEIREKNRILHSLWAACPVRNSLCLAGGAITALYFLLRRNYSLMKWAAEWIVKPYHRVMGLVTSVFPFSFAELIYAVAAIFALWYSGLIIFRLIKGTERLKNLYRYIMTIVSALLCVYGGFCLLWGVYYHSFDFAEASGMNALPVSTEELKVVTEYFAELSNEYALQVPRENGVYTARSQDILDRSKHLYEAVEKDYEFLAGRELRPKGMLFSEVLSYMNFTGFFFPFTGEANLNIYEPVCMLPSTCAHEIAHQRGIAPEDEANFVAVLACMQSEDIEFKYSAALLAYIHLGNALYSVDKEAHAEVYYMLNDAVLADLEMNSLYWDKYETKTAEVSEAVYTGFLQSHGETLGMRSYGACVDLLVAHYYEEAALCS